MATAYPLADIAQQIAKPYADVTWIVESGQSLAGVQPSDELMGRIRVADIVISGGISAPWANQGFSDPYHRMRIVRLDLLPAARSTSAVGLLWLDPIVVRDLARELCDRMVVIRPQRQALFRQRADDYVAQIDALVQQYQPKLAAARTKKLLVLGTDFHPLLLRFGLEPVLAAQASPTQVSDSDMALLKRAARESKTRLLVVPADTPAVVVRDLELRGSLQVVLIDCLGSSAASGRNTYLDMLRWDLDQLAAATAF